jgi:hypothetical protein
MRMDFNVLWVEDLPDRVRSTVQRIEPLIRREGFRLKVEFASTLDKATEYLSDGIYGDHIDLVLMDYDLGAGGKGDDGLGIVRRQFPFKDIVFYSADAPNLPALVANQQIQGVFCSMRDDLHDTVLGVFETLMKKVLDIDHSRGIVMGATSDIDQYVNECLVASFDAGDEQLRAAAMQILAKHLKEKSKSFSKELELLEKIEHVAELQPYHGTYTSNDRLRLLKNLIEKSGANMDMLPLIDDYLNNTVRKRNDLAHVKVKINGFSRTLYDRTGEVLTGEKMKGLRQELLAMQLRLEQLHSTLHPRTN